MKSATVRPRSPSIRGPSTSSAACSSTSRRIARALTLRSGVGIQLVSAADGSKKRSRFRRIRGSRCAVHPDGAAVAYLGHTDDATHIWMTDIAAYGRGRSLTPLGDARHELRVRQQRQTDRDRDEPGRARRPARAGRGAGPQIRISEGDDRNRLRTFPSLMTTPCEFTLLKYHDGADRAHRRAVARRDEVRQAGDDSRGRHGA